jgi:tRNA threonylcarbamoyladenosine biosynthesis protein TsaE
MTLQTIVNLEHTDKLEILTQSPEDTMELAKQLGALLEGGMLLALEGEMGAGKTHFIKGLALGLGYQEQVTSPTFNLIHEYKGGRLPLYHFDVYRLEDPAELESLGYEEYFFGAGVTAVEWSGMIKDYLPEDYLHIRFEAADNTNPQLRRICFTPVGKEAKALICTLKSGIMTGGKQ